MKRNFKKLLKKGICIGMAGAMIVTGSAEYLGVHPVMKAEASVADISTAKSKEEALELLCDKTVMIVQTVKEKYESILTDSENLISNYDKTSDIEREIYKEYGDVFTYVLKVKDFSKSELWNYTTKSKVCTEQQVSACKKILEKEIIQLQNYNSESLDKYNEIRASMNIKIKDLKDNGSAKWETANTANQKCMDELKGFFQNFTSKIESMKANYQELETVCSQYTDMQNKLPQNTVNPTPIVTLAPTSTVTPTSTVSYSTTRVAINIKNNAETYIKSCILTRISKGKESVHGDYNAGVSVQNGFSFGCDSNSTVTIKNITLSNGKTFPDISFWVGTTDLIYDLDLTSYEDYIVPTLKPTVTPTIKPIVTPTVEPMVTPTI
ncbi:MAG: hypothetical protein K2N51_08865, partial [Lachnospiraceae bacterium]|nr:hypothetical protein [Lachnospiraceae bacterium]